ncbi:MAG: hypothetical protein SVR94_06750, partial [Pseudomonadota bacterium]|nr:hypothetical protein [Pseudomonadota bacterium]
MKVTFKYAGEGAGVEATWHPDIAVLGPDVPIPSPANVGGATDGEWILYQPDDTFYRSWILRPLLGTGGDVKAITGVKIEGLADLDGDDIHSVFDIYYGPFMTPGTRHGRPFEPTALPEELVGDGQPLVTATYSEPVAIIPDEPQYDIYGTLDIHFEAPWNGMTYNPNGDDDPGEIRFLAYIADTDCVKDLSVDLSFFNAQMTGEGVKLTWETGTEDKNAKFEVYRGIPDGQGGYTDVTLVGSVDAEGNGRGGASYELVDPTGGAGFSYGLVDIDTDGMMTVHDGDIVTPE